jgi:FKBP-type peptidyl-prolyl cis-trans isomerase SlyD
MAIQVISYRCVLRNQLGQFISSTFNRDVLATRQPGSNTLTALVDALQDLKTGEKRTVSLRADQAYGFYDPKLVITRHREALDMSESVKVGDEIVYDSEKKAGVYRVVELSEDLVTLDGNHPLAGQDLVFEIEATNAREATASELEDETTPQKNDTVLFH